MGVSYFYGYLMKKIIQYGLMVVGLGCIRAMMFGFDQGEFHQPIIGSVYADGAPSSSCNNFGDAGCEEFCRETKNRSNQICQRMRMGSLEKLASIADSLLSFLYLIMWPLLYVAGLAMDNTLVYGEGLGLTGLLYQFWSIMRTFSNFAIVFLLVYVIGSNMFEGTKGAKQLGSTFIAIFLGGLAINFSWFGMGALVDLSTVATYAVGTLPLTMQSNDSYCKDGAASGAIKSEDDIKKLGTCRPLLSTHSTINLSETFNGEAAQRKSYFSYKEVTKNTSTEHYFLTCPFVEGKITDQGRNNFLTGFANGGTYKTSDGTTGEITKIDQKVKDYLTNSSSLGRNYCVIGTNQLLKLSFPMEQGSGSYYSGIVGGMSDLHNRNGLRIRNLVDSNKGMIGVMYTMYGNMLGFSQVKVDVKTSTPESQLIQLMIKSFFGLVMLFPLIALCAILLMRVAVLWIVIAFSPLFVLIWVIQAMGIKNEQLQSIVKPFGEKAKFENILNLLMQPVLVVFVMSIGLMFLDSLIGTLTIDNGFGEALSCPSSTTGQQCCKIIDMVDICFEKFNAQAGSDAFFNYFTYGISNIIGVMVLWFMIFGIMKSNKITGKVASQIETIGKNYLGSMPIVPWFDSKGNLGGEFVGVNGAAQGLKSNRETFTKDTDDQTAKTVVQPSVDKFLESVSGNVSGAKNQISKELAKEGTPNLETSTTRGAFGNKLLDAVTSAKKEKEVKYSGIDQLVDTSDSNIKNLMSKYGVSKILDLLAHPQFLADIGKSSSDIKNKVINIKDWTGGNKTIQAEYTKSLIEQASKLQKLSSTKGYIDFEGTKTIFDIVETKSTSGNVVGLDLAKKGSISSQSNYKDEDVASISGVLNAEEFEKLTNLKPNGKTITVNKDEKVEVKVSTPAPVAPASVVDPKKKPVNDQTKGTGGSSQPGK